MTAPGVRSAAVPTLNHSHAAPERTRRGRPLQQLRQDARGGGTGGGCQVLESEKSQLAYAKSIDGWTTALAPRVQIMSIFGVSSWPADLFSVVFPLLTM